MSMAIGHFGAGAGLATGLTIAAVLAARRKISVGRETGIGIVGGGWAMLGDAGQLIPSLKILGEGWWTDLFWFHRFLDNSLDPNDSVWISTGFFAFWFLILGILWLVGISRLIKKKFKPKKAGKE